VLELGHRVRNAEPSEIVDASGLLGQLIESLSLFFEEGNCLLEIRSRIEMTQLLVRFAFDNGPLGENLF
jgi:hypothetical protein